MKKNIFLFIPLILAACSGAEEHNLSAFKQTDENSRFILRSMEQNKDHMHASALMPGMKQAMMPFVDRGNEILKVSAALYNQITEDINAILEDHGVSLRQDYKQTPFNVFSIGNDRIDEPGSFAYDKGDWICAEMEKLFNQLVVQIDIDRHGQLPGKQAQYKRPADASGLKKYKLDLRNWNGRWAAEKLPALLLIPVKNEKGESSAETMFEGLSMTETLEKLNFFRQRVLMACDIALASVQQTMNTPNFNFNKAMPVAYRTGRMVHDSVEIKVFVAAMDTTDMPPVHYSIDKEADYDDHEVKSMTLLVPRGARRAQGVVGVKERGELKWRPWRVELK